MNFPLDLALLKVFSGMLGTLETRNRNFDHIFIDNFLNIEGFSVKYEVIKNVSPAYALYYIEDCSALPIWKLRIIAIF